MEDFIVLGIALLIAGAGAIGFLFGYEFVWKPRRQKRIERNHARSKVNGARR